MTPEEKIRRRLPEWDRISTIALKRGVSRLGRADRRFYCLFLLEAEVTNGGFDQYLYNSSGDQALEAVAALRAAGLHELAALCTAYFALLPGGVPAPDQRSRQDQLLEVRERMGEAEYDAARLRLERPFWAQATRIHDALLWPRPA